ncbi:hypothetical protein ACTHGU_01675 [Chitinophagaceae bacterium MMS25-I14]
MKQFLLSMALGIAACCTAYTSDAQKQNSQNASVGCMDPSIRLQSQEIKQHFLKQGFVVYKDAMISMSSMEPYPVIVELQRGQFYQIIFIGNIGDSKMRLEVYNGHDQKIDEKLVMRNREQPNYITYSFVPEQTDSYLFTLMQKMKNKDMCGSFTILQLKSDKKEPAPVVPYEGQQSK